MAAQELNILSIAAGVRANESVG